jgi:hypothetical protein
MLLAHLLRMSLAMKENESSNPPDVALLGRITKMPESNSFPYEIQKFFGSFM